MVPTPLMASAKLGSLGLLQLLSKSERPNPELHVEPLDESDKLGLKSDNDFGAGARIHPLGLPKHGQRYFESGSVGSLGCGCSLKVCLLRVGRKQARKLSQAKTSKAKQGKQASTSACRGRYKLFFFHWACLHERKAMTDSMK